MGSETSSLRDKDARAWVKRLTPFADTITFRVCGGFFFVAFGWYIQSVHIGLLLHQLLHVLTISRQILNCFRNHRYYIPISRYGHDQLDVATLYTLF